MFTGIIEEVGRVKKIQKDRKSSVFTFQAERVLEGTQIGDSIAVNGLCLTVTELTENSFEADVMAESLERSTMTDLEEGSLVNLERAVSLETRLGGHMVSGHIDGIGLIREFKPNDNAVWVTIDTPVELLRYIIEKGSITIDGVSLTVARVDDESFSVAVIPHTASETGLLKKEVGDAVNLECDMIGKYVEKLLKLK